MKNQLGNGDEPSVQLHALSEETDPRAMMGPVLRRLEDESIYIIREAIAESQSPVLLYSIGKDSSVLLHLAIKAFYPAKLPCPLLHIDTTWKFREMIEFRDRRARELGVSLLTYTNADGLEKGINPFSTGSAHYTSVMKTEALKQALDVHKFDMIIGGSRRDEEKSRAKERIFSLRESGHRWDPRSQRPEFWNLHNSRLNPGQTMRVFPLSNWTELDIWLYIHKENVPVVPLYFAAERPVVVRNGSLIMVDDGRFKLAEDETPQTRKVRFRTLGCYPLTAAIESDAETVPQIIDELFMTGISERSGRLIDHDEPNSMEEKKVMGYF